MNIIQTWTDEVIARLEYLWSQKLSCGRIANEMGLTRNSVVGKLYRMGLSRGHPHPLTRSERNERRKIARSFLPRWKPSKQQPVERPIEASPLNIGFMKLKTHHCRWVTGKGDDGLACYCGHTITYKSWCADHCDKIRQAPERRLTAEERAEKKRQQGYSLNPKSKTIPDYIFDEHRPQDVPDQMTRQA